MELQATTARTLIAAAAAFLAAAAPPALAAGGSQRISFQGKLLDTSNNPRNGTLDFTFRIFNAATGGAELWSESQTGVSVNNGVFTTELGKVTAIPIGLFSATSAYLEVEVPPDPAMTPRQQFLMSPVAFRALMADDLAVGNTNYIQVRASLQASAVFHVASGTVAGSFLATGPSSFTATGNQTFSLNASSGIRLQAGTLLVQGSGGVDAAGPVRASTLSATAGLLLPQGVASTLEGSARWDAAADKLAVGTGAGSKTMADTDSAQTLTNKTLSSTGGNTVDATHLRTRPITPDAPSDGMTIKWDAGAGQWYPVYPSTISVIFTPFAPGANVTLPADTIFATPIVVPGVFNLTSLRYRVTTAQPCSGRIGLYAAGGELVVDVAADFTSNGAKAGVVTGGKTIQPGQYYFAMAAPTVAACAGASPAVRGTNLGTTATTDGVIVRLGRLTVAGSGTALPATLDLNSISNPAGGNVNPLFFSMNE